jgi:hypothetical protein
MAYDLTGKALHPLSTLIDQADFPLVEYIPVDALESVFSGLFYTEAEAYSTSEGFYLNLHLAFEGELALSPPGFPGVSLVAGAAGSDWTAIEVEFLIGPEPFAALREVPLTLRLAKSMLKPMRSRSEVDESKPGVDISLGTVGLALNSEGFDVDVNIAASIPLCMIADSGVLIEAANVRPIYGRQDSLPEGLDPSFRGVFIESARIYLPEGLPELAPSDLTITNCSIGTGGFSGGLALNYNPIFDPTNRTFSGHGAGSLFGMQFGIKSVGITFKQNCLEEGSISGSLVLSYFDAPLDLTIGLSLNGGFTAALSSANGLITLEKEGILSLTLESIRFALDKGVFTVAISGEITPDIGDLEWPTFRVEELSIDSKGNVRLDGGWLNLREAYTLSFYGFQLEISKIGFGSTEAGQRWIGFSGGLKLVDGLTAGASVEGLRILWDPDTGDTSLTLSGVGVEMDIPNAIYLKGYVAMTEPTTGVFRFDGDITLTIRSINLEIEAQIVIGYDSIAEYTFFAIYVGVELPAGIPLGQTSLALYGMAGLFALNMEPGRAPEESWYAIQPSPSWYHKAPEVGVYHLRKWAPQEGSLALGAGITIGTLADNGLVFNGRMLLVLVLPGPIIMLEGRANLLKERSSLRDEPVFRSLAVLDFRQGIILFGVDAQYLYDESGSLLEIGGGTEFFFDFNDLNAWHLYLGIDEPRDRRIRAQFFEKLFEANGYFMLQASGLRTGAWIGYDKAWDFGPLHISLEAWLEGAADLSFKPPYFKGFLWLHGSVEAKIFGFGFGLSADARITAGVFDPFHIVAELSISLDLPWPFKDVQKSITLEWGPDPVPPLLPVPLKEVAIEHLKVTSSWPLPTTGSPQLLWPTPDTDNDGFWSGASPAAPADNFFPAQAPIVPLDARPHITFGRLVHDRAGVGVNSSPVHPADGGWEWIGDQKRGEGPARLKVSLLQLAVERRVGNDWQVLASKVAAGQGTNTGKLFGSWAPTPALPGGNPATNTPAPTANSKLWLWSRSPFDYTQRTGGEWEEWFTQEYPDYPCVLLPEDLEVCCDFSSLAVGPAPVSPWSCTQHPQITIAWRTPPVPKVEQLTLSPGKTVRSLCFASGSAAMVLFGREVKRATISVAEGELDEQKDCVDFTGWQTGPHTNPIQQATYSFDGRDAQGQSLPELQVTSASTDHGMLSGLANWLEIEIILPAPAAGVEIQVSTQSGPVEARAFDSAGNSLGKSRQQSGQRMLETLRLDAPAGSAGISRVLLRAPNSEAFLHGFCVRSGPAVTIVVQALDASLAPLRIYQSKGGRIELEGERLRAALVSAQGGGFCLAEVCVVEGLSVEERMEREEMLRHVVEGLAHWESDGEVLPAWSQFRLKIVTSLALESYTQFNPPLPSSPTLTQYAYFCTEGPPGLTRLSLPVGHPLSGQAPGGGTDAPAFDSGLDDLVRYVRQTVPPTVPAQPGEKPLLPRPVYCAYDVGVQFNENYVDQMYAAIGRDLSLYLFDNNNLPSRDAHGRLLAPPNRWGRQASLSLSRSEERWLRHLDATACADVDWTKIPRDQNLQSSGQVLASDTLYEARLIPLLFHETFTGYTLSASASAQTPLSGEPAGGWSVVDVGTPSGQWTIREDGNPPSRYIAQGASTSRGTGTRDDPFPGGTFLLPAPQPRLAATSPDQPVNWTDYRLSAFVRSGGEAPVGLALRWSSNTGYLFYLDRAKNRHRLVRVDANTSTTLVETSGGYQPGLDSAVSFEAIGDTLRVFVAGEQICEAKDSTYARGRIGLFSCDNSSAEFRDVRVDDLRKAAPVVYRYKFITSRYSNFIHHAHSFRDLTFTTQLPDLNDVAASAAAAVDPSSQAAHTPPTAAEITAYELLAGKAIGVASHQQTSIVDITRIEHNTDAVGFLIRTGEPLDWKRTSLIFSQATKQPLLSEPPDGTRIISVSFAFETTAVPTNESVTVLMDEATNLTGWRIEMRLLPDSTNSDPQWEPWYTFGAEPLRAAGQRVRIFAEPAITPSSIAGEDYLFIPEPDGGFQPKFPLAGVDLRLVVPDGRVAHMRRFLSTQAYTPSPMQMLRSADGTGLILIKSGAAALSPAEHRLHLEYKLDNTTADPNSIVLSQNGDTTAETAQIDIPWATPTANP